MYDIQVNTKNHTTTEAAIEAAIPCQGAKGFLAGGWDWIILIKTRNSKARNTLI